MEVHVKVMEVRFGDSDVIEGEPAREARCYYHNI